MGAKKSCKTLEERRKIREDIENKFQEMGVTWEKNIHLFEFKKILEEYTMETITASYQGSIDVPDLECRLEYALPLRKWNQPMVRLVPWANKSMNLL